MFKVMQKEKTTEQPLKAAGITKHHPRRQRNTFLDPPTLSLSFGDSVLQNYGRRSWARITEMLAVISAWNGNS
jgi:hypothetical protein